MPTTPTRNRLPNLIFALTIFLGAFLVFQVQPLIARLILPWFGGSSAVWTCCMLFFQTALLAGYAYAHWLGGRPQKLGGTIHMCLLAASLLFLPIIPAVRWKPGGGSEPLVGIFVLLTATVGLPYILLSSTSPLLQTWFSRSRDGASTWRYFALSNAGSMLGLLVYPFLVEPFLTGHQQAWAWSGIFGLYWAACLWIAFQSRGLASPQVAGVPVVAKTLVATALKTAKVAPAQRALWIGLAALPSALLLAITHHLTQNLAPIPLLWIVPLSLYLLSFIICFDSERWYHRGFFAFAAVAASGFMVFNVTGNVPWGIFPAIGVALAFSFVVFMVCHGELARRKPATDQMTGYYLMISTGGAIGGALVALVAPHVLNAVDDLAILMCTSFGLFAALLWSNCRAPLGAGQRLAFKTPVDMLLVVATALACAVYVGVRVTGLGEVGSTSVWADSLFAASNDVFVATLGSLLGLLVLARTAPNRNSRRLALGVIVLSSVAGIWVIQRTAVSGQTRVRLYARNSYGGLVVTEAELPDFGVLRTLSHGTVNHGEQLQRPEFRRIPTSYYSEASGVGRVIRTVSPPGPLSVGVIGLGAGTLAAYSRPNDRYRFYEINPLVDKLSREQFSFLSDSKAEVSVVMGDARLSLEAEPAQNFDILVVDAFSGDAIPVHLLTREAFQAYWRHLKPDGVLAIHVSNSYLNLAPVLLQAAFERQKEARIVVHTKLRNSVDAVSDWVLVTSRYDFFEGAEFRDETSVIEPMLGLRTWTDDFSNLYSIFRW